MGTPFRLVLAGLGDIGLSAHLPALLRAEAAGHVDLVAMVDPSAERRDQAKRLAPGVPAYNDVDYLPADLHPDGFVLATPPWVTTDLAALLLREGYPVLAEKPIATSVRAARPLIALVDKEKARLQVGLTYRHDPALATLRDWIRHSPLDGSLLIRAHIYDEQRDPSNPEHEKRIRRTLEHGAPVVHEGAHVFDWLSFLLEPDEVRVDDAWAVSTDPAFAVPNLIGARLSYPGRATVLCEYGWLTDRLPQCELSFLGQRAHAILDGFTFRLRLETAEGERIVEHPGDRMTRCFDRQLEVFLDLLDDRAKNAMPGLTEGLAGLVLAEQVVQEAMA